MNRLALLTGLEPDALRVVLAASAGTTLPLALSMSGSSEWRLRSGPSRARYGLGEGNGVLRADCPRWRRRLAEQVLGNDLVRACR